MNTFESKELVTIPEVAAALDRCTTTIWRWIRDGLVITYRRWGRTFVLRSELERLLQESGRVSRRSIGEDGPGGELSQ